MRRTLRLIGAPARPFDKLGIARGRGLILLLPLLAFGAYAAYWWIAAGRIAQEFDLWAQHARTEKLEISWRQLRVTGFPIAFRLELHRVSFRYAALRPAPILDIPVLSGSARPWNPVDWRLMARRGLTAEIAGTGGRTSIRLAARSASGAVAVAPAGGAAIWLILNDATVAQDEHVEIGLADTWIVLPPRPSGGHGEPLLGIAWRLRQVRLPVTVAPLGDTIDALSAGLTVKGALPPGPLLKALAAWRDAGGTVVLDHLRLRWGALGATGAGTMALDRDLQPVGGFSGAIEGYDEILTALVRSGHMRVREAGLARLALTMLAKAGPDGRPEIATSFTIENGEMYLGPARLGPAPRIAWE